MSRKPQQLNIQPVSKRQPQGKSKGRFPQNPDDYPCPVCGESNFEWGYIKGTTYSSKKLTMFDVEPVRGRLCLSCGNVLNFLNDSK